MKLIVISSANKFESELKVIPKLFDCGLETFHLRKPKFSFQRMNEYLSLFPQEHLSRVIIHTHHRLAIKYKLKGIHLTEKQKRSRIKLLLKLKILKYLNPKITITSSFHSLAEMVKDEENYNYIFLSPVFDSISKKDYKSAFAENVLIRSLSKTHHKVYALGGIKIENIYKAKEFGFYGAAVLGSIWKGRKEPVEAFIEIRDACAEKKLNIMPMKVAI